MTYLKIVTVLTAMTIVSSAQAMDASEFSERRGSNACASPEPITPWPPADPHQGTTTTAFTVDWGKQLRGFHTLADLQHAAGSQGERLPHELSSMNGQPRISFRWRSEPGNDEVGYMDAIVYQDGGIDVTVTTADGNFISVDNFGEFICDTCSPPINVHGVIPSWLLPKEPAVAAGSLEEARAALRREDYACAFQLFRSLAEQDNSEAERILGRMYTDGSGVPKNYTDALKWLRKAALHGDSLAEYRMGEIFRQGSADVPQNYAEAMKWYLKAAGNEDDPSSQDKAQFALGIMYAQGQGVPQDFVVAHMWFNLSAARGGFYAASARDTLVQAMTPEQVAEAQRLAREWKPKR